MSLPSWQPPSPQHRQKPDGVKNASFAGTINDEICFAAIWIFRFYREFYINRAGRRIDVLQESRKYGQAGVSDIASEGLILVSSSTERSAAEGGRPDGATSPDSGTKSPSSPRKRRSASKEDAHVSQALRTVYQRAVEEDIPSEMLDLLSKLD